MSTPNNNWRSQVPLACALLGIVTPFVTYALGAHWVRDALPSSHAYNYALGLMLIFAAATLVSVCLLVVGFVTSRTSLGERVQPRNQSIAVAMTLSGMGLVCWVALGLTFVVAAALSDGVT